MQITKGDFINYIKAVQNVWDFQNEVLDLARKYAPYSDLGILDYPSCDNELIELLEKVTNDTDHWIPYFCYEVDFGREWQPGDTEDEDGNSIPMRTIEDLWEALNKK